MTPIGLVLLLLTGVGPLLAWRNSTLSNLGTQFIWPGASRSSTAARAVGCFGIRGVAIRSVLRAVRASSSARSCRSSAAAPRSASRNTGTDLFTALVGLVGTNKRRYGGYIVHVGIVLICFGFAGNGSNTTSRCC